MLYTINPRQDEAAVEQAQGQLNDAKAKVELARRKLTRANTLIKTDAVSQDADRTSCVFWRSAAGEARRGPPALKAFY